MAKKNNVFLFYGEETYLAHQKLKLWREKFEEKYGGDMNIAQLEGKGLQSSDLESDIQSAPFLAEKRLVIVTDFLAKGTKDEQKKVAEILEKEVPDFCILVFSEDKMPDKRASLYKKLNKVGNLEEFTALMGHSLAKWIMDRAVEKEMKIPMAMADYLGEVAGSDLWNLENELNKLKMYSREKPITKEAIDDLVHPNLTTTIFKFTDYLAQRNPKGSLHTLHILLESGEDIVKILFMIVRHFRILIQVKDLVDRGTRKPDIVSRLKQHPYTISTTMQQSPNFSPQSLRKVYEALLQIDIGLKTGKIRLLADDKKEILLALEQFVHTVCA
ncbi:DNA polymerase III subunit delta [Patescibacteria group bacterium]